MIILRKATEIRVDDEIVIETYDSSDNSRTESHQRIANVKKDAYGQFSFHFAGGFTIDHIPQDAELRVVI